MRQHRYTDADSADRLAKRLTRLREWVRTVKGELTVGVSAPSVESRKEEDLASDALSETAGVRPVRREDVTDQLVERVIGAARDLLSIEFFELGLLAARCVGRVVTNGEANGTGFVVAPGLILTNQHVLRDAAEAAASEFELDFEANQVGEPKRVEVFTLLPRRFFHNDKTLDFAVVAVNTTSDPIPRFSG